MSLWSIGSITLAIAIVSLYSVFSIPLFAKERHTNNSARSIGIFLYLLSSILVSYETRISFKSKELCVYFYRLFLRIIKKCKGGNGHQCFRDVGTPPFFCEHNLLAYFFFIGYTLNQIWILADIVYFYFELPECFSWLGLVANLAKVLFATVLLITIIVKTKEPSAPNPKISAFVWAFVGAVCFSSAFKYVVEEETWGYIDIVAESISDPTFGLNITNGTTVEEYVPEMLKSQAHCIEHVIFSNMVEYILELKPFSTEYFSLATVFCVVAWNNVGNPGDNHEIEMITMADQDQHTCDPSCLFSLRKWFAIPMAISLVLGTYISIVYFYRLMEAHQYTSGIWLFILQQLLFQLILVSTEVTFYFRHMLSMNSRPSPPRHFQLDAMMLIFPLLPLGVLFALRVFPDLIQLADSKANHLTSPPLWTAFNVSLALFNYFQVAVQAIFISEVFCRLGYGSLKKTAYFFLVLASVNFCIWLSWCLECKLVTFHQSSFRVYGAVEWIIIVYATVPFVLFCFAHSTACFLEIMSSCFHDDPDQHLSVGFNNLGADQLTEDNNSGLDLIAEDDGLLEVHP